MQRCRPSKHRNSRVARYHVHKMNSGARGTPESAFQQSRFKSAVGSRRTWELGLETDRQLIFATRSKALAR
jgi:hypothetical protein